MDTKIQELTDKIYKEGVEKGNEEAGRIIADANAQKQAIVSEAEAEAKRIVAAAQKQAAELKKNTEAELKLFATQAVEALKSEVVNLITGKITSSNVKAIVSDTAFMQKVILEMAKEWAKKEAITTGNCIREDAKITGTTPAVFTFNGINEDCPPTLLLPWILWEY